MSYCQRQHVVGRGEKEGGNPPHPHREAYNYQVSLPMALE